MILLEKSKLKLRIIREVEYHQHRVDDLLLNYMTVLRGVVYMGREEDQGRILEELHKVVGIQMI